MSIVFLAISLINTLFVWIARVCSKVPVLNSITDFIQFPFGEARTYALAILLSIDFDDPKPKSKNPINPLNN